MLNLKCASPLERDLHKINVFETRRNFFFCRNVLQLLTLKYCIHDYTVTTFWYLIFSKIFYISKIPVSKIYA